MSRQMWENMVIDNSFHNLCDGWSKRNRPIVVDFYRVSFLKMGTIVATFHMLGTKISDMERSKRVTNGQTRCV